MPAVGDHDEWVDRPQLNTTGEGGTAPSGAKETKPATHTVSPLDISNSVDLDEDGNPYRDSPTDPNSRMTSLSSSGNSDGTAVSHEHQEDEEEEEEEEDKGMSSPSLPKAETTHTAAEYQKHVFQLEQEVRHLRMSLYKEEDAKKVAQEHVKKLHGVNASLRKDIMNLTHEREGMKRELEAAKDGSSSNRGSFVTPLAPADGDLARCLEEERAGRRAALHAWEKAEKRVKELEGQRGEVSGNLRADVDRMHEQKLVAEGRVTWMEEENERLRERIRSIEQEVEAKNQECVNLRMQVGTMQGEMRANAELEKVRSQIVVESLKNDVEWQVKAMQQQLDEAKLQLQRETVNRLKLEKAYRAAVMDLEERDREIQHTHMLVAKRKSKTRSHSHKLEEMDDIDHQLEAHREEAKRLERAIYRHSKQIPAMPSIDYRIPPPHTQPHTTQHHPHAAAVNHRGAHSRTGAHVELVVEDEHEEGYDHHRSPTHSHGGPRRAPKRLSPSPALSPSAVSRSKGHPSQTRPPHHVRRPPPKPQNGQGKKAGSNGRSPARSPVRSRLPVKKSPVARSPARSPGGRRERERRQPSPSPSRGSRWRDDDASEGFWDDLESDTERLRLPAVPGAKRSQHHQSPSNARATKKKGVEKKERERQGGEKRTRGKSQPPNGGASRIPRVAYMKKKAPKVQDEAPRWR